MDKRGRCSHGGRVQRCTFCSFLARQLSYDVPCCRGQVADSYVSEKGFGFVTFTSVQDAFSFIEVGRQLDPSSFSLAFMRYTRYVHVTVAAGTALCYCTSPHCSKTFTER